MVDFGKQMEGDEVCFTMEMLDKARQRLEEPRKPPMLLVPFHDGLVDFCEEHEIPYKIDVRKIDNRTYKQIIILDAYKIPPPDEEAVRAYYKMLEEVDDERERNRK